MWKRNWHDSSRAVARQFAVGAAGGRVLLSVELAWGRLRRWYLKTLRPSYVGQMGAARYGSARVPDTKFSIPRDLKYCRNQ